MPEQNEDLRKVIVSCLGLETSPEGDEDCLLIRNADDEVTDSINFKPEVGDLMLIIRNENSKVAKAFGGCNRCYGKGYATVRNPSADNISKNTIRTCSCDRGKALEKILAEN